MIKSTTTSLEIYQIVKEKDFLIIQVEKIEEHDINDRARRAGHTFLHIQSDSARRILTTGLAG